MRQIAGRLLVTQLAREKTGLMHNAVAAPASSKTEVPEDMSERDSATANCSTTVAFQSRGTSHRTEFVGEKRKRCQSFGDEISTELRDCGELENLENRGKSL